MERPSSQVPALIDDVSKFREELGIVPFGSPLRERHALPEYLIWAKTDKHGRHIISRASRYMIRIWGDFGPPPSLGIWGDHPGAGIDPELIDVVVESWGEEKATALDAN